MSRTVSNLKDSVSALLSGIDLSQTDNLYGAFERAARIFTQKAKIPETQGTQNILIYDGVTDYLINTSIFGTNITDIRPQGISRTQNDFVYKKMSDDFDRDKEFHFSGTMATFDYVAGTPVIRIVSSNTTPKILLDSMAETTGWTNNASITGLTTDPSFFYQRPASLRFNMQAGGSQGYLEKTINAIDLTSYQGTGVGFLAVELPTTDFTLFTLRIGSDSSNYYEITNTAGTLGNITGEFMLVAFDLSLATTVGSPDISSIKYLRVALNYDGTAQTNVRLGYLFISLPCPNQILYTTAGFFSVSGTVSNSITTDADVIILNDSAYTIYEYECANQVLQQQSGGASDSTLARIDGILNGTPAKPELGLYTQYKSENPSESLRTSGSYYSTDLPYSNNGII